MRKTVIKTNMGSAEWSRLVLLSMLWGSAFFLVEIALLSFSPLLLIAVRFSMATLLVWLIVFAKGYALPRNASAWLAFLGSGLLNNVIPLILIVWSQTVITAGLAAILTAATPIIGVALAGLGLRDEPITRPKIAGTTLGLIGVGILVGPAAWAGLGINLLAQLAVLGAAVSFAFAGVYGRRFGTMGIHPMVAAAGQLLVSSTIMIPLALCFEDIAVLHSTRASAWAAVAALAIFSTALAYVIYFDLLERAGAVNLLLVNLLLPVTAILLGFIFLDEKLSTWQFAGMAVIWLSLAILDGRLWRRLFLH
ncbi:MAG: DMT family transporter [Woeseiaceae bacterium]